MMKTLLEEASCDFYGDPKLRLCQDIFLRFGLFSKKSQESTSQHQYRHNSYSKLLKITYPADPYWISTNPECSQGLIKVTFSTRRSHRTCLKVSEMDSAWKNTPRVLLRPLRSTFVPRLASIFIFYTKIIENRKFHSDQKKSLLYFVNLLIWLWYTVPLLHCPMFWI